MKRARKPPHVFGRYDNLQQYLGIHSTRSKLSLMVLVLQGAMLGALLLTSIGLFQGLYTLAVKFAAQHDHTTGSSTAGPEVLSNDVWLDI